MNIDYIEPEIFFLLMQAICLVESGDNEYAIGDNGYAWGCMQIHECVIKDVNEFYGYKYKHSDAFTKKHAQHLFLTYIDRWIGRLEEKEERKATLEDIARIWNGGPNGYKKESTLPYWEKVQSIYNELDSMKN